MKPAAGGEAPLLFAWEKRRRLGAFLPVFLALSLLAHGATFFLFRVVYPARVTIPPPTPEVTLLTPGTPEAQALFRWIDAEDPALVATGASGPPIVLREVRYRPSFEKIRTAPRTVPAPPTTVQFPPAKPPLEIIHSSDSRPREEPVKAAPQPTRLGFAGSLEGRARVGEPALIFTQPASAPLESAQFLVGVSAEGKVRFTFRQKSSGSEAKDAEAAAHLERLAFAPASEAITWGIARVEWGDDAYAPPSSQPAPPR